MLTELLLPDELREFVRLSEATIYRLRRKGEFPAPIIIGEKRIAYRRSEVMAWLEARTRAAYNVEAA